MRETHPVWPNAAGWSTGPLLYLLTLTAVPPGRLAQAKEGLGAEAFRLTTEIEQQRAKMTDINEYLSNELRAKSARAAALEAQLAAAKEDLEAAVKRTQVLPRLPACQRHRLCWRSSAAAAAALHTCPRLPWAEYTGPEPLVPCTFTWACTLGALQLTVHGPLSRSPPRFQRHLGMFCCPPCGPL